MFMPPSHGAPVDDSFAFEGPGLSNLEYAFYAEEMGRSSAAEVFNCSAPDTGNMETLHRYGSEEQKKNGSSRCSTARSAPLSDDRARSGLIRRDQYPEQIRRDGNQYVINGRKWWSKGASDARCRIAIVMGRTDPSAEKHKQQSMILVPLDTPGVKVERPLLVFGYDDAPHGHMEIVSRMCVFRPPICFSARAGASRSRKDGSARAVSIIACAPSALAEHALETMCVALMSRDAFGKTIAEQGHLGERIADVAHRNRDDPSPDAQGGSHDGPMGNKAARGRDRDDQGRRAGDGLQRHRPCDSGVRRRWRLPTTFGLARAYAGIRALRIADGPDEVHRRTIARLELKKHR